MAQAGFTPIQLYFSNTATNVPLAANLANGELAINITDGKLFYKDNSAAVQVIAWKTTPTSAGGTGLTSYTAGDLLFYATGSVLNKLGIGSSGTILKSSGTAPAWDTVANLAVETISFGTTGLTPSTATKGAVTVAGTLVAVNGGTGQSSFAVGDILYASTTTALSRLADVATGNALISGGVGVAPSWGKIGLTTHVSGTLPIANGGTNGTSTPTNGAVAFGNGTAFAFTAAGTSGQVLSSVGAGTPVWKDAPGSGPAFSVYRNGTQTITSGVYTKVQLNVETFDTNNNFDSTTNYRFTPTTAGYYQINGKISATGSTVSTSMASAIYKNGSIYKYGPYVQTTAAESNVQDVIYFNGSTDYVELFVYITATIAVIGSGAESTYFSGVLVRVG